MNQDHPLRKLVRGVFSETQVEEADDKDVKQFVDLIQLLEWRDRHKLFLQDRLGVIFPKRTQEPPSRIRLSTWDEQYIVRKLRFYSGPDMKNLRVYRTVDQKTAQCDLSELGTICSRTIGRLRRNGIEKVGQLVVLSESELLDLKEIVKQDILEIQEALDAQDLCLSMQNVAQVE